MEHLLFNTSIINTYLLIAIQATLALIPSQICDACAYHYFHLNSPNTGVRDYFCEHIMLQVDKDRKNGNLRVYENRSYAFGEK